MSLYRRGLEKQKATVTEVGDLPDGTDFTEKKKILTELPAFSHMGIPLEKDTEDPSSVEPSDDIGALQNKVFRIEAQLNGLGKKLDCAR